MASTAGPSKPPVASHSSASHAASSTEFQPYVKPNDSRPEFTFRAIFLGCIFGILFGAVTVYVGLRAGLTVAASIPIAVLSISVLRALGRASILENNIVQTTGNAGQSIAAGVIFTLPALIFLGFDLEYSRIFFLALLGGWLGVFFMIPLRRELIVKEHGHLTYPEGTACADVLLAGERGGSFASRVFWGLGLGGLYTLFQNESLFSAWPGTPNYEPKWLSGSAIRADATRNILESATSSVPELPERFLQAEFFLAGADARDSLLRRPFHWSYLSRHPANLSNDAQRFVGRLRSSHGSRRGGRSRNSHAAAHRSHDLGCLPRRPCDYWQVPRRRRCGTPDRP